MNRRVAAIIAALGLVLGVLLLVTARTTRGQGDLVFSYSSTDSGPGGVLALRRWLSSLGLETRSVQGQRFAVPEDVDLLFVLGPLELVRREDAELLRAWVGRGGTLVVASDRSLFDEPLFEAFGATVEDRGSAKIGGEISPALRRPVLKDLSTSTGRSLALREPYAVLVGDGERAIVATRRVGDGTVILSSAPDMFANGNLGAAQNDRLVLNVVGGLRRGAVVGFDEFHHGAHLEPDLFGLFFQTGPGRALLFAGAAAFLYLALRGRRFGSPVPIEERPARSSLDYVRSFAGLLRRSGADALAGERLARLYRRRLARALGLRPSSGREEVLAALARSDPRAADGAGVLLRALERGLRDNDLLAAVARAEALLEEVERR